MEIVIGLIICFVVIFLSIFQFEEKKFEKESKKYPEEIVKVLEFSKNHHKKKSNIRIAIINSRNSKKRKL